MNDTRARRHPRCTRSRGIIAPLRRALLRAPRAARRGRLAPPSSPGGAARRLRSRPASAAAWIRLAAGARRRRRPRAGGRDPLLARPLRPRTRTSSTSRSVSPRSAPGCATRSTSQHRPAAATPRPELARALADETAPPPRTTCRSRACARRSRRGRPALLMAVAAALAGARRCMWPSRAHRARGRTLWNPAARRAAGAARGRAGLGDASPPAPRSRCARGCGAPTQAPRLLRDGEPAVDRGRRGRRRRRRAGLALRPHPAHARAGLPGAGRARREPALSHRARRRAGAGRASRSSTARRPTRGCRCSAAPRRAATCRRCAAPARASSVTFDRDLESLDAPAARRAHGDAGPRSRRAAGRARSPIDRDGEYELTRLDAAARRRARVASATASPPLADAPPLLAVRIPQRRPRPARRPAGPGRRAGTGRPRALRAAGSSTARTPPRRGPTCRSAQLRRRGRARRGCDSRWDASPLGLLPGETATFRFELLRRQRGLGPRPRREPDLRAALPLARRPLREDRRDARATSRPRSRRRPSRRRELQKSLDKLARQQPRAQRAQSPQAFERSEEMKSALERQQEISAADRRGGPGSCARASSRRPSARRSTSS